MKPNSPKVVYLDQNAWSYLADGYANSDSSYHEAACAAIDAAERGKAIFPLSIIHYAETSKDTSSKRRRRVARYMSKLSGMHAILPSPYVRDLEISNACNNLAGMPKIDLNRLIFGIGLSVQGGLSVPKVSIKGVSQSRLDELNEKISQKMTDPDSYFLLVRNSLKRENVERLSRGPNAYVAAIQESNNQLSGLTRTQRYNFELYAYFGKYLLPKIMQLMSQSGTNYKLLEPVVSNRKRLLDFFRTLPTSYSFFALEVHEDVQPRRKVRPNDIVDLIFLSVAIPYCDVVVTEKHWVSVANQTKLDREYGTTMVEAKSVTELPSYL